MTEFIILGTYRGEPLYIAQDKGFDTFELFNQTPNPEDPSVEQEDQKYVEVAHLRCIVSQGKLTDVPGNVSEILDYNVANQVQMVLEGINEVLNTMEHNNYCGLFTSVMTKQEVGHLENITQMFRSTLIQGCWIWLRRTLNPGGEK